MSPDGHPLGLSWQKGDAPPRHAARVKLTEEIFTFRSGALALRGKLVRPEGKAPLAAVVLVHGSEADSAVDYYFEPYMYAANGFASLVFDKRGTGKSEGEYIQNFSVLADDVRAAVRWLREQPGIDPAQVHLAGFSQGGWIAPLAAFRDGGIRSLIIGYGPMVPVTGEDRWGYVDALRTKGFGDDAIAGADRMDAVIGDILDRNRNRWSELGTMLDAARSEPWFEAVKGSDSILGMVTGTKMPLWMLRVEAWWRLGRHHDIPFIDRLYNPVPTVAALSTPSLWIYGGKDSSMPTQWSVDELKALQARGKPIEYVIYPQAEHGILHVVVDGKGEQQLTGYEPGYFQQQIDWLKQHGGGVVPPST
jgi:alpha-beta hydrolase superfamily lysophospholipase